MDASSASSEDELLAAATPEDWRRIRATVLADAQRWRQRLKRATPFVLLLSPLAGLELGGAALELSPWGALLVAAIALAVAVATLRTVRAHLSSVLEDPLVVAARVAVVFHQEGRDIAVEPLTALESSYIHLASPRTHAITEQGELVPGPTWRSCTRSRAAFDVAHSLREDADVVLVCHATGRAVARLRDLMPAPSA